MSFSLTIGPLTPDEVSKIITVLTDAGLSSIYDVSRTSPTGNADKALGPQATQAALVPPPGRPAQAMPPVPVPGGAAAPPPPPAATPAAAQGNAKLEQVLKLMDAYSRAGHQIAGARKVLGLLGLSRVQDANEEQLEWLSAAFANTAWSPE